MTAVVSLAGELPTKSFSGVVAMETFRPQKVCERDQHTDSDYCRVHERSKSTLAHREKER